MKHILFTHNEASRLLFVIVVCIAVKPYADKYADDGPIFNKHSNEKQTCTMSMTDRGSVCAHKKYYDEINQQQSCLFLSLSLSLWCLTIVFLLFEFRVITNDDIGHQTEIEGPITSASIVRNIRNIMNDTKIVTVPIQAYIIPTVDAHQVPFISI